MNPSVPSTDVINKGTENNVNRWIMSDFQPIHKALVSVWDKTGLDLLATALHQKGVVLYSTGGTAQYLRETCKVPVTLIETVTDFPEMMAGRVKTLHPRVFGGILARRGEPKDLEEAAAHGIPLFDLVVCNLYPFWEQVGKDIPEQSSFVDIGGPSMIRAAAKNHASVMVLSNASEYSGFVESFTQTGGTSLAQRRQAAAVTFARTSQYDGMIAQEWNKTASFPSQLNFGPASELRYGENPHQKAVWCGSPKWNLIQGKTLSYNNLLDTEAALRITREFETPVVAIVKHNNPCGVASGHSTLAEVYMRALACDAQSAFGGIVATNAIVDKAAAEKMGEHFLEVVLAKGFTDEAKAFFQKKKNLRLIEWPEPTDPSFEVRASLGGWLLQSPDSAEKGFEYKTVTRNPPPQDSYADINFAWKICKHVRSNAIVLAKNQATLGIGAGQMSRVDAVRIALEKSSVHSLEGAVLASDAFFPFRDNIDLLKGRNISVVVQPGGSVRDEEVIAACEDQGIAMVFTGKRHFRH